MSQLTGPMQSPDPKYSVPYAYDNGGFSEWYLETLPEGQGDCGVRALAIAGGLEYEEAVILLRCAHRDWRPRSQSRASVNWREIFRKQDPCNGVFREAFAICLGRLGFELRHPMLRHAGFGDLKPDFCMSTLPRQGEIVIHIPGHFCAMVDGVIRDTWDSGNTRRGKPRKYLNWWAKAPLR